MFNVNYINFITVKLQPMFVLQIHMNAIYTCNDTEIKTRELFCQWLIMSQNQTTTLQNDEWGQLKGLLKLINTCAS